MPFEIAHPVRPARAPRFSEQQAWALFPPDAASRYETPMLLYALAFYACYAVGVAGWVPMWAAGVVGVILLLRYFNQAHEMMHADVKRERAWHPARTVLILMSPIYLGFRELRESHLLHHREEGSPRDPDLVMMAESPLKAGLWCLLQPEQSAVDYIQRFGLSPKLAARMAVHAALFGVLMWLGGWWGALMYNVMTRVGNGLAFFVFAWAVHMPLLWGQVRPPRFPRVIAQLWVLLISWDNLVGIRFHFLHHVFPHIPDRHLPEVSRRLAFD